MKKLGLFTNCQFDDILCNFYQSQIKTLANEPKIELIDVMPQGTLFANDNPVINTSLFESCFRSALEYATNVLHCDVLAIAMRDTNLHSIAEEVFNEFSDNCPPDVQFVSLSKYAIAVCNHYKRITRPGILCVNNIDYDSFTRTCFEEAGYQIVSMLDSDIIDELNRRSIMVLESNHTLHPDADELRYICGVVESAAKDVHINGILCYGYLELCQVLNQGGTRPHVIDLVDVHINAIVKTILL